MGITNAFLVYIKTTKDSYSPNLLKSISYLKYGLINFKTSGKTVDTEYKVSIIRPTAKEAQRK